MLSLSLSPRAELSPLRFPPFPHVLYLSSGSVLIFSFLALCALSSRFVLSFLALSLYQHALFPLLPRALRSPSLRIPLSYALRFLLPRAFPVSYALNLVSPSARFYPLLRALRSPSSWFSPLPPRFALPPRSSHFALSHLVHSLLVLFWCSYHAHNSLLDYCAISSSFALSPRSFSRPEYHLSFIFLQLPHRPISAYQPQPINATLTIPPS